MILQSTIDRSNSQWPKTDDNDLPESSRSNPFEIDSQQQPQSPSTFQLGDEDIDNYEQSLRSSPMNEVSDRLAIGKLSSKKITSK